MVSLTTKAGAFGQPNAGIIQLSGLQHAWSLICRLNTIVQVKRFALGGSARRVELHPRVLAGDAAQHR
jgi:hypothetical protein